MEMKLDVLTPKLAWATSALAQNVSTMVMWNELKDGHTIFTTINVQFFHSNYQAI